MGMDANDVEMRAQAAAQAILDEIQEAGGREDARATVRRINEIRDPRVRGRVIDILRERRAPTD
jgi:hypothetical protein